jgi:hypothetical protein
MRKSKFSIMELESYLNLIQTLIDDIIRKSNINNDINNLSSKSTKLNRLNRQRDKIIAEIEKKLDETFSEKD